MNAGPAEPAEEKSEFQNEADSKRSHIFEHNPEDITKNENLDAGKQEKAKTKRQCAPNNERGLQKASLKHGLFKLTAL